MAEPRLSEEHRPEEQGLSREVMLLGQPNVGKSAMFAALTRSYVTVSNYPGTTVEIAAGKALVEGRHVRVLDTPGVQSFIPTSDDERVTRDMLLRTPGACAVMVGDAKNLERSLSLALQLGEMQVPFVLCLNMMDEARDRGIVIDETALSQELGVDVVGTVAVEHRGIGKLRERLFDSRPGQVHVRYPRGIEQAIAAIAPMLPDAPISARSLALMVLAGDATLLQWLRARLSDEVLSEIEEHRQLARRRFRKPVLYEISQARLACARAVAARATTRARPQGHSRQVASWLERMTVHPVWGVPILGGVLYLAYLIVGKFGAGTLVGFLEERLFGEWINPAIAAVVQKLIPSVFLQDLLVGPYGVVSMALTYAVALILPIVATR